MPDEPTITITVREYNKLMDSQNLLTCLQNAGVDNWEGYDFAMEDFHEGPNV